MIEFERSRHSIQGRTITLTSWFDPKTSIWRASAPGYIHLIHDMHIDTLQAQTREQAVKNLATHLMQYLDAPEEKISRYAYRTTPPAKAAPKKQKLEWPEGEKDSSLTAET